jgi:hypothetical protein
MVTDGLALADIPEIFAKRLKAVERSSFGVHLDPRSLVNSPAQICGNRDLLSPKSEAKA